jgi:hypothetical protein
VHVVRSLLVQGNSKLSQAIHHFDLPAGDTCPGASALCRDRCYAQRGRFVFPQVRARLQWCYAESLKDGFAATLIREIRRKGSAFVVRIHCAGDFYSAEYVRKWAAVIRASPTTQFYAYTRSYRDAAIEPTLRDLAALDNLVLWYSADAETGYPASVPPGVRVAWMQVAEDEVIPPVDLVFRDYPLRKRRRVLVGLNLVCPHDTPQGRDHEVTCGNCGRCWR